VSCAKKDDDEEDSRGTKAEVDEDEDKALEQTTERMPADLLIVVDVSGSMSAALPSVRKCLASLSGLVQAQDRLSLVKFDDRAEVVLPWTPMDSKGVAEFRGAQKDLIARGGTCFVPVLKTCLQEQLADEAPGRTRSMVFISDGMPEEGDQQILQLVCEESSSPNMTIITAGFGAGVKADLMGSIAQAGCGPFIYIPDEQSIPLQLGRVWDAVAYTSVCASYLVVRPLGGAVVTAVEGAFGTAELCLRPDGSKSDQQVMLMQVGPVRHGTSRQVAFRVQLPEALQKRPLADRQLRSPLVEVSLITETVSQVDGFAAPVFLQKQQFLPLQVPSLLSDVLVPFPMRFVLDNDLDDSFDADAAIKQVASCLGVDAGELQLNQILRGSIIIDISLKPSVQADRAAEVLKAVGSKEFQASMSQRFEEMGYKMKSAKAPGQQVFRRLLQARFAGALGAAADTTMRNANAKDVPELRAVQKLAVSDMAESLDPPCQGSMAAAVKEDCTRILKAVKKMAGDNGGNQRHHLHHNMLQLKAAHVAQYKCQTEAASLEVYEVKEAKVAAQQMERACGGVRLTTAFLDSASERIELRTHDAIDDHLGVFLVMKSMYGCEEDFCFLARELCPTLQVKLTPEGGSGKSSIATAFPVHADNMLPVCVKSHHPSTLEDQVGGRVNVPCARRIKIVVDKRSCIGGTLSFYAACGDPTPIKVIHRTTEPATCEKPDTFHVAGADLWYTYQHAKGASIAELRENWGFEFQVSVSDGEGAQTATGMLFQASFKDVPTGPYKIDAVLNKEVFEVPPTSIVAVGMEGRSFDIENLVAASGKVLQVDAAKTHALGLRAPALFVGVNGMAVRKKESARFLGNVPDNESVQAVILSSKEHAGTPIEEFAEKKVATITKKRNEHFVGSLAVEA